MVLCGRAPVNPEQWVIVEGKLFLDGSSSAIAIVTKDPDVSIAAADAN